MSTADPGVHVRRVLLGGFHAVQPTPSERATLAKGGVTDPLMQQYLCWRRSLLLIAAPAVALSGVLALIAMATEVQTEGLSGLGVLVAMVPYLAVMLLPVVALVALGQWARPRAATALVVGWGISIAAPVLAAFIPADMLIDASLKAELQEDGLLTLRMLLGVFYVLNLLPTLLSFPSGIVRGGVRVKAMLPTSTVAGWLLMMMVPLYSLFFLAALILINQLLGTAPLILGAVLMAIGPFVHLHARKLYTSPLGTDGEVELLRKRQRLAGLTSVTGAVLIVLWAVTADVGGVRVVGGGEALIDPLTAILRGIELVARVLLTTVVFSQLLLVMTVAQWRSERTFRHTARSRQHDEQMAGIDAALAVEASAPIGRGSAG